MKDVFKREKFTVKKTINLAQRDQKIRGLNRNVTIAVVLVVVLALFVKFGVVDRITAVSTVNAQAAQEETLTAQMKEQVSDFQQVNKEYQNATVTQYALSGKADPMDCLTLIENKLLSKARISSFTISADTITVKLSGVTLNSISEIYQQLMTSGLVSSVQVYTAATDSDANKDVTASLTIKLAVADNTDSGTSSATDSGASSETD